MDTGHGQTHVRILQVPEHGMYAAAWVCDHLAVGSVSLVQPWRSPCSYCRSCCPEPVCLMVLHLCDSTRRMKQKKKTQRSSCWVFWRQHSNTFGDKYMQCDHGMIWSFIPHHNITYYTTPHHTIAHHTIAHHTIPYHAIAHHPTPDRTVQWHTTSYPVLPYPTKPYCTI